MSFSPRRPRGGDALNADISPRSADTRPGSVRTARERMLRMPAERTQTSKPLRPDPSMSPKSPKQPWETATSPNSRQRTYEQDYYSRPQPGDPSWPLPSTRFNPLDKATPPPIRKDHNSGTIGATLSSPLTETFYDGASDIASPRSLQHPQPAHGRQRDSNTLAAPGPDIPRETASWASSNSEGIPDFPLPTSQYQTGRRSQNSAPPTKSRRGLSSFYSQLSGPWGVSPIPEEPNPRTVTNSYASSNVMPSQIKEFFMDETPSDDERSIVDFDWEKDGDRVREPSPGLVRQASLGRRQKPALTTIKGENLRAPTVMPVMPLQVPGSRGSRLSHVASILDGESVLLDASASVQGKERRGSDISFRDPFNPGGVLGRMGSLRRGEMRSQAERQQNAGLAGRVGTRRPPNLDVQAVREAEARASLTSLPDLIRRATRLAANLDRGRTASRLGMDWALGDSEKSLRNRPSQGSSLGGMLAAFPPPATIRGQSPYDGTDADKLAKDSHRGRNGAKGSNRRRQICGMSRRAFAAVCVVIMILVAAAVVLPVFLIALPNRDRNLSSSTIPVSSALQACQNSTPCSNGGTSVINLDQSCGCVCTNGFTGPQCASESRASCTTISVPGASASVGTQIPGLMQAARDQYMIPLDNTALSSVFAANAMTCTTENAIVTLPGTASPQRRSLNDNYESSENDLLIRAVEGSATTPLANVPPTISTAQSVPTANGSPALPPPSSSSPVASAASSSSATKFAQIGILFVLQDSRDINTAVTAQENLGEFFQEAARADAQVQANNVTLGSGYLIDLTSYIFTLRNGTRYGIGVNFNGTPSTRSEDGQAKRGVTALQLLRRITL